MKGILKSIREDKVAFDTIIPLEVESALELIPDGLRERIKNLEAENKKLREIIKILECEAHITEYFQNRYPSYTK